jgi:hypothetical protein
MGKQKSSPLRAELIRNARKLSKRTRRLEERLQNAQEAKERIEDRLHYLQARLQKKTAKIQRLQARLSDTHIQLQDVKDAADALSRKKPHAELFQSAAQQTDGLTEVAVHAVGVNGTNVNVADKIGQYVAAPIGATQEPVVEEPHTDEMVAIVGDEVSAIIGEEVATIVDEEYVVTAEAIVEAQEARAIAMEAEEAARVAIERAQSAESRLDKYGIGRHVELDLEQLEAEAERAQQVSAEAERVAREAAQVIWPYELVEVDEDDDLPE